MDAMCWVMGGIGLAVGGGLAWVVLNGRRAAAHERLTQTEARLAEAAARESEAAAVLERLRSELLIETQRRAQAEAGATRTVASEAERDRLAQEFAALNANYVETKTSIVEE